MATIHAATPLSVRRVPRATQTSPRAAQTSRGPDFEAGVLERLWGWRACDRCGETIMLGEGSRRLRHDGSAEDVCLDCACAPSGVWSSRVKS